MANNQESTADSLQKDVSGAIKMGKDAAKTAKTIGKAASHAATGNVAGAAIELAKDPETLKKIILALLIPIFILATVTVTFLYALPIPIYEGASSYFEELGDAWEDGIYSSDGGVLASTTIETLKLGGRIVSDSVKSVWNSLMKLFKIDSTFGDGNGNAVDDGSDKLSADGKELYVAQTESAERETLEEKVSAAQKKLNLRATQIESAIRSAQSGIDNSLSRLYRRSGEHWVSASVNVIKPEVSQSDAIKFLSAYTVTKAGSLENQKLSDFMKWLGYYRELTGNHTQFNIGGSSGTTASVKTWCGTFMPQYLVEQMNQDIEAVEREYAAMDRPTDKAGIKARNKEMQAAMDAVRKSYEKHQAPAADLFFTVHSPDFATEVTPIRWTEDEVDYVTANITITISSRSVESLSSEIFGFWQGNLEQSSTEEPDTDTPEIDNAA